MRRILLSIVATVFAVAVLVLPAKETKAATDGYVLTYQAQDLLSQSRREYDEAKDEVERIKNKIDKAKSKGDYEKVDKLYKELEEAHEKVDLKRDKIDRAQRVLDFVNTRTDSEIFLASMQEKYKNQASLKPMQDRIDGAKAVAQAQLTQIQVIQQAIQSQTALAQVNPAIFAQVQELNAAYQQELAQYQAQQELIAELQAQYDAYAATMPMPTAADNARLAEIRQDFAYTCSEFDKACSE